MLGETKELVGRLALEREPWIAGECIRIAAQSNAVRTAELFFSLPWMTAKNSLLAKLFRESTHVGIVKAALTRMMGNMDDYNRSMFINRRVGTTVQVRAGLQCLRSVGHAEYLLFSKAMEHGLISDVIETMSRLEAWGSENIVADLICYSVELDRDGKGRFELLKPFALPDRQISDSMARGIIRRIDFINYCSPLGLAHLFDLTIDGADRFDDRLLIRMMAQITEPLPANEESAKLFLANCALVAERGRLTTRGHMSEPLQSLDRFLNRLVNLVRCSPIEDDHWLTRFASDRSAAICALHDSIPAALAGLSLEYVV